MSSASSATPIVSELFIHNILYKPHHQHYADLSEGIELLKCLSGTFSRERACLRLSQSLNYLAINGAVCIQLTNFSRDDCGNTLSYYHHQIGKYD